MWGIHARECALCAGSTMMEVRFARKAMGVIPAFKRVDTCAAEFDADTPYMYSTYDGNDECAPTTGRKVRGIGHHGACCGGSGGRASRGVAKRSNPHRVLGDGYCSEPSGPAAIRLEQRAVHHVTECSMAVHVRVGT